MIGITALLFQDSFLLDSYSLLLTGSLLNSSYTIKLLALW